MRAIEYYYQRAEEALARADYWATAAQTHGSMKAPLALQDCYLSFASVYAMLADGEERLHSLFPGLASRTQPSKLEAPAQPGQPPL